MSDRAERETKSGVWWHGNLGVKPFLNQRGSTLVLLSFVLSTLTGVGIFYGLSQATDFNILGNERRMFLSDAAIEFAIDEIASFYDTQLASLPENAKENGAKGPSGKYLYKQVSAPGNSTFSSIYRHHSYKYNIDFIRSVSTTGESINRTKNIIYEINVDLYDAVSNQIVRTGTAQFTRLVPAREGAYYEEEAKR